mmetsp:Transcript_32569/g.28830  ORF Transcript_32569/g.28830 Transcript_32569/m.28830 type:complete len:194 (+) Transcript_32569:71-652(+)
MRLGQKRHNFEECMPKIERFSKDFSSIMTKTIDINTQLMIKRLKKKFSEDDREKSRTLDFTAKTAQRRKIFLGSTPTKTKKSRNSSKSSHKSRRVSRDKTPEVRIKLNFDTDQLIITKDYHDTQAFLTERQKSINLLDSVESNKKNHKRQSSNSLNGNRNGIKEIESKSLRSHSHSSDRAKQRQELIQKRGIK